MWSDVMNLLLYWTNMTEAPVCVYKDVLEN